MKKSTSLSALCLLLFTLLFSSCASPEFGASWRMARMASGDPKGIEGAWKGRWQSEATGHTGNLKLVVTPAPAPAAEKTYDFHYWASWKTVLAGDYHVTYTVREKNGQYHVTGEKDLGSLLGGLYTHEGVATPTRFDATYKAPKDHGSVTLTRP